MIRIKMVIANCDLEFWGLRECEEWDPVTQGRTSTCIKSN